MVYNISYYLIIDNFLRAIETIEQFRILVNICMKITPAKWEVNWVFFEQNEMTVVKVFNKHNPGKSQMNNSLSDFWCLVSFTTFFKKGHMKIVFSVCLVVILHFNKEMRCKESTLSVKRTHFLRQFTCWNSNVYFSKLRLWILNLLFILINKSVDLAI